MIVYVLDNIYLHVTKKVMQYLLVSFLLSRDYYLTFAKYLFPNLLVSLQNKSKKNTLPADYWQLHGLFYDRKAISFITSR